MPYYSKKQIILFITIFFALSLFLASDAYAANWYVRQGATGSANGTDWTDAYTSLPATLTRGDTYYIADGNYSGRTFNTAVSGSTYITIKKATSSDYGTGTGWSDSYGDGQATFSSGINFESSYWIFDGVTGGGPGQWGSNFGFKITETNDVTAVIITGYSANTDYITIRHVDMQGKGSVSTSGGAYSNDGIAIYGNNWSHSPSHITVSYAWMHGIGRCPIFFAMSGGNQLFEYIYVSSYFVSDAVHGEVMSTTNMYGDVTFRNNLVTDVHGTGGLMWDNQADNSAHLYVYGNVFYKPVGASWDASNGIIGGWTGGNGEQSRNLWVYNNTFIGIDLAPLSTFPNTYSGNIASNNIFYNSTSPDFSKFATHDYNHFINSGGTHSESHGTSATSGDPFASYITLNFALTSATFVGLTLASPTGITVDPLGVTRGADGVWDRGAYEYIASGSQPDTTPPTLSNGLPTGQLSAGTSQATLSLTTDENAACKYSLTAGTTYSAMTNTFSTTGAINHSTNISGLTNGSSYNYYIRCQDTAGNPNTTDFPVSFSIASGSSGNLLLNPDFEGGFTSNLANNWNITTDGSIGYSISQDTGYQGSAQKINISSPGSWGLLYYQTPSFQLNQFYNWSFWYKTEGIGSLWAQITNAPHTQVVHSESLPSTNGQWTYKTINFQYTNSLSNQLRFSSNATSSYWIDNVQLAVALPSQDITPPSAPQNLSVN